MSENVRWQNFTKFYGDNLRKTLEDLLGFNRGKPFYNVLKEIKETNKNVVISPLAKKQKVERLFRLAIDRVRKAMDTVDKQIDEQLRVKSKTERIIMAEKTSEIFRKTLAKIRGMGLPKELLEEIAKLMREIFKKRFKEETKDFPDNELPNLFPSLKVPKKKHEAACNELTAAAKAVLAANGITPCNAYNHGLCFCGWGGTRTNT